MVINTNMAAITSASNLNKSTNEAEQRLGATLIWLENCQSIR